jgi:hypothetical protein
MDMSDETRTTRQRFLLRLGKTAAIGLGVALVPAKALAGHPRSHTICCPDTSNNCSNTCGGNQSRFFCQGTCPSCCICHSGTSCVEFFGGCIC